MEGQKNIAWLEKWAFVVTGTPYTAPEALKAVVSGNVYNDSAQRFKDGEFITTGSLLSFDSTRMIVTTRSTTYVLGKIDPLFEVWLKKNDHTLKQYEDALKSKETSHGYAGPNL